MKKSSLFLLAIAFSLHSFSQSVGINTDGSAPNASAALDVKSTNKGMLVPRMTSDQRNAISSPATGLLVFDNTTGSFWFYGGASWTQLTGGGGGSGVWNTNAANIYNNNTGNVGIGITNPTNKLHIGGTNPTLGFFDAGKNHYSGSVSGDSTNLYVNAYVVPSSGSPNTGNLILQTGPSRGASSTGNVGIGVSTPTNKLDVKGNLRLESLTNTVGSNVSIYGGATGNSTIAFYKDITNPVIMGNIGYSPANDYAFWTKGTAAFLNTTGMGIGKVPDDKLDVKGNMRLEAINNNSGAVMNFYGGTTATNFLAFHNNLSSPGLNTIFGSNGSSDYSFWVHDNSALNLNNTGLGINTTTPLTTLHITGGQDAGLGGATNGYLMMGNAGSTNIVIDNNEIIARNNGAVASLILQNDGGTVRIGNAAVPAGYSFAVNGKMIGEELKVQLSGNWPDYVFKKDYQLAGFDELRNFISTNNHLPNIPPAAELEKNGLEVGDMQRRMMEKIEELTLYILELENRMKQLETERVK